MPQRPIAEGLIEFVDGEPHLLGGRRRSDGRMVFPLPHGPESQLFEPVRLSPDGCLWSYTVQRFRPKSPPYAGDDDEHSFKPFALGYVELKGEVIVESRLEVDDFADLEIGMPMRLGVTPFRRDSDGVELVTYVFRPA